MFWGRMLTKEWLKEERLGCKKCGVYENWRFALDKISFRLFDVGSADFPSFILLRGF